MSDPLPVAVIGAGIIGAACALELQKAGAPVILIDRDSPGRKCSFGNAGLIADDHVIPLCRPSVLLNLPRMLLDGDGPLRLRPTGIPRLLPWLLRFVWACRSTVVANSTVALSNLLADASQDFKSLLKSAGAESLLQEQGALLVFESANSLMQAQRDENVLREYGIQFESLNGAQAASRLGRGAPSVAGGRFYPEMKSVVDPYAVVNALVQQFITSGGKLHRRHVKSFDFHPEYVRIITDDGDVNVSKAVLAAGTGSPALMKTLGLSVPMAAERGYHVMLDGGPTLHMPWTFHERGFVATPMTGGTRLAGTVELGGGEPDWRRAMLLARHMQQLFPDTIMSVTQQWTGNRPTTPDYLPVMGPLRKNPRILTAFGHQHLGLTLSATTARLIRLLINKQPLPYSIEPFRPERFTI